MRQTKESEFKQWNRDGKLRLISDNEESRVKSFPIIQLLPRATPRGVVVNIFSMEWSILRFIRTMNKCHS